MQSASSATAPATSPASALRIPTGSIPRGGPARFAATSSISQRTAPKRGPKRTRRRWQMLRRRRARYHPRSSTTLRTFSVMLSMSSRASRRQPPYPQHRSRVPRHHQRQRQRQRWSNSDSRFPTDHAHLASERSNALECRCDRCRNKTVFKARRLPLPYAGSLRRASWLCANTGMAIKVIKHRDDHDGRLVPQG